MKTKKLAIIGTSYLQVPLILKAKEMGIETHAFAWAANDIGEKLSDYFYPISIVEKELILKKCREIHIDGICSIASDLAIQTVNYVACALGLTSNSMECTAVSTKKHLMRERFSLRDDPSPVSYMISNEEEAKERNLSYPIIVKPLDRSGSRGITKVCNPKELKEAIKKARNEGFDKHVLIEEFVEGDEYSVEYISWQGEHHFLTLTKKYTTGAPAFIETGHLQPAPVSQELLERIKMVVSHALDSLEVEYGASHSELKVDEKGSIKIIEIGARMGGDLIGSHLVRLSTGFDFLKAVIDIAMGNKPELIFDSHYDASAVRYILDSDGYQSLRIIKETESIHIIESDLENKPGNEVTDSGNRWGYLLAAFDNRDEALQFMNV